LNPLRFVILSFLFYILFRLMFGGRKKQVGGCRPAAGKEMPPAQDILVEDPVCHVYIPQGQAVSCRQDGRIYYFCSDRCCNSFLADSERSA